MPLAKRCRLRDALYIAVEKSRLKPVHNILVVIDIAANTERKSVRVNVGQKSFWAIHEDTLI
jgi:hypothetical protein